LKLPVQIDLKNWWTIKL